MTWRYLAVVRESTPASDAVAQTCEVLGPAVEVFAMGIWTRGWAYAELWSGGLFGRKMDNL